MVLVLVHMSIVVKFRGICLFAVCQAWMSLSLANLLMTVMLILALYHNCSVTTRDGVEIPLRDAVHNIRVSPAWANMKQTIGRLIRCLVSEGLYKFMYELRVVLDAEGENSAYTVRQLSMLHTAHVTSGIARIWCEGVMKLRENNLRVM